MLWTGLQCVMVVFPDYIHLLFVQSGSKPSYLILIRTRKLNIGSYMSAHVLLNLLKELGGKEMKCEAWHSIYHYDIKITLASHF